MQGNYSAKKKLIEGFLRGRAGIVWGSLLIRFPSGGHFVDAIHAKGAFQLSFCRYFRQKLFVLNWYVSMIDKSHWPKSHFLGWNTSLAQKITEDIIKYYVTKMSYIHIQITLSQIIFRTTSLTQKITKDIDKYVSNLQYLSSEKKTVTLNQRCKLFILLLLLSLLSFFMFDFYFSASRPCYLFRNKHPVWGW